jgi:DNA repair protein RecO (recombination protein O)
MNWNDIGFLLSKTKYSENSIIAEIFTQHHGKCSGLIFGATSNKIKNYLQIGNLLHLNNSIKNENKIGSFKVEILKAYTPLYFDNKKKLLCITSAINLLKILTVESQANLKVFNLIDNLFFILKNENWIQEYIYWELELLKLVGYDLELSNIVIREKINNEIKYFVKSNKEKKNVPTFLIESNKQQLDKDILLNGLKLVGDYMNKSILKPNNISYPESRSDFINFIK